MASRKKTTADILSGKKQQPAGWQDQIAGEAAPSMQETTAQETTAEHPKKQGKLKRKTYLMTEELIARIEAFAEEHNVGINEALRFLVITGLDAIEQGDRSVETQAVVKNTLGV